MPSDISKRLGQPASEFGLRVAAEVLDDIWGIHNLQTDRTWRRVDFSDVGHIEFKTHRRLSTFDFDFLTQLVVRCHDACIRLEVYPRGQLDFLLVFHARQPEGEFHERHPTIEQAIERVRGYNYFGPAVQG